MKHKLLRIFFLFSVFAAAAACSEDFLEKEPLGKITEDVYFKTAEQAVEATNAVYNGLRRWEVHVFAYVGMTDMISDDSDKGSTATDASFLLELDNFTFNSTNIAPFTVYDGYYQGIHRANVAIERIPAIEMDEKLKNRLVAESKFLRAYYYFNLVRWFGGVSLNIKPLAPSEFKQPRATKEQVYAQIIKDLQEAAAALPKRSEYAQTDIGRATKGAAEGMLAKVYLTLGDFAKAEPLALSVINSGEYELYPSYEKLFQYEGENSKESLFEVQATADAQGLGGSQFNEVQGVRGVPNLGWGFNRPSDDLVKEYESGDPRREATILYVGEILPDGSDIIGDNPEIVNERYNQKAWVPKRPDGSNGLGGGNIRILRYADVLLIAAEALNENGKSAEALNYLNQVRKRARGTRTNVLPDVTVTDKAQLRQRIWKERRVELALEQQRWFDLLRQNRASSVMKAVGKNFVDGKHELFPIPQNEIDLSGGLVTQNPNY